jgi:hypothetical protein
MISLVVAGRNIASRVPNLSLQNPSAGFVVNRREDNSRPDMRSLSFDSYVVWTCVLTLLLFIIDSIANKPRSVPYNCCLTD